MNPEQDLIDFLRDRIWSDGKTYNARREKLLDPKNDLRELSVGYFKEKVLHLPIESIPETKPALERYCRDLIAHCGDLTNVADTKALELHIEVMTENLPGVRSLSEHINSLWSLRNLEPSIYKSVVRGLHGKAIAQFTATRSNGLSTKDFKLLLARHSLLLCAMDAQIAVLGARAISRRPFGKFLDGIEFPKGGTPLRLMTEGVEETEATGQQFQTIADLQQGPQRLKPLRSKVFKLVRHILKDGTKPLSWLRTSSLVAKDQRRLLDEQLTERMAGIGQLRQKIEDLKYHKIDNGIGEPKTDNVNRTFNEIWLADLNAVTQSAVALMRFAMAESHVERMVSKAFEARYKSKQRLIAPMPPPRSNLDRSSPLFLRTLDLLDSARRLLLDDPNYKSKTPKHEREIALRDPDDMAGLKPVSSAYEFLRALGKRQTPCFVLPEPLREHHLAYYHLDAVPEVRLNSHEEADLSFVG